MNTGRCHNIDDGEGRSSLGDERDLPGMAPPTLRALQQRDLSATSPETAPSKTEAVIARLKARYDEIRWHANRADHQLELSKRIIHAQAIRNDGFVSVLERFEREISVERCSLAAEQSRLSVVAGSTAYLLAQRLRRIRIRLAPSGTLRDRIVMNALHRTRKILHGDSDRLESGAESTLMPAGTSSAEPLLTGSLDLPLPDSLHWDLLEVEGWVVSRRAPIRLVLAYLEDRCFGEVQFESQSADASTVFCGVGGATKFRGQLSISGFKIGVCRLTIRIMDEVGNTFDQHRIISITPAAAGLTAPPGRETHVTVEELMGRLARIIRESEIDAWFDDLSPTAMSAPMQLTNYEMADGSYEVEPVPLELSSQFFASRK